MKSILVFIFLLPVATCLAQQKENCRDVVYLNNGSILRGKIIEYDLSGDLAMITWSGAQIRLTASIVRKVKQRCRDDKRIPMSQCPYSFRDAGWYHASRAVALVGHNGTGLGLQHSSGLKINRLLGLGAGGGVENFTPAENDVATYPVFGEVRGYLLPRNVSPFYAIGVGWGFVDQKSDQAIFTGFAQKWQGGRMLQGQIGYRIGNHFTVHIGLRFQRKTRTWEGPWQGKGVEKIRQKRLELGVGILL